MISWKLKVSPQKLPTFDWLEQPPRMPRGKTTKPKKATTTEEPKKRTGRTRGRGKAMASNESKVAVGSKRKHKAAASSSTGRNYSSAHTPFSKCWTAANIILNNTDAAPPEEAAVPVPKRQKAGTSRATEGLSAPVRVWQWLCSLSLCRNWQGRVCEQQGPQTRACGEGRDGRQNFPPLTQTRARRG